MELKEKLKYYAEVLRVIYNTPFFLVRVWEQVRGIYRIY